MNNVKRKKEDYKNLVRKSYFRLILVKVKIDTIFEIFVYKIKGRAFGIWTGVYFLTLFVIVYAVGFHIPSNLSKEFVSNLYLGEAAVIGTVLTIAFSFSIFLIQHAAQNLPSGFYKLITRYIVQDIAFFISTFLILGLFVFSLLNGNLGLGVSNLAIQASLFMVGTSLYLMFYLYYKIGQKVDPFNVLGDIKNRQISYLEEVRKRAEKFAKILKLNINPKEEVSNETALAFVFGQMPQRLSRVNNEIQYMFDYHDKVLNNQEKQLALYTLSEIGIVIQKYFEIRKDSSLILPYGFLGRTSDSQPFLTPSLERYVAIGKNYIRLYNNDGITQVINVLASLSLNASEMKFTPPMRGENPVVGQCRGYLDMLMDSAITYKSEESLFQGTNAYQRLGLMTVDKDLALERSSIYSTLYKIGFSSTITSQQVVFEYVITAYVSIFNKLMSSKYFNLEMEIKNMFEHVDNLVLTNFLSIKAVDSIQNRRFSQEVLAHPYKALEVALFELSERSNELTGEELRKNNSTFVVVAEQLRSSLRGLSEKMGSADHILIDNLARVIGNVGSLLIELYSDKKWSREKKELEKIAGWYIHQPYWFTHDVNVIDSNLSFKELPKAVLQIGVNALEKDLDDLVIEAIKDISLFATLMIKKEKRPSYGFTEPRIMKLACYLGILALKHDKKDIVDFLKDKIKEFEKQYKELWFPKNEDDTRSSIKKDQLMIEVLGLVDKVGTRTQNLGSFGNEESKYLGQMNKQDVEKFLKEIWGVSIKK